VSAFYLPLDDAGERWRATVHTTGPWDPGSQHGGPPSALLARAMERLAPREEMVVARVTVEILGAVPVGELALQARVARPGRSVELLEAVLSAGGRDVARASAWRVRRTSGVAVAPRTSAPPALPAHAWSGVPEGWVDGYLSAVEWRVVDGGFDRPGPCTAWTRLLHPLVPDEEPTGLQRVLAVADSGNGLSSELPTRWLFINPELSVHLHREPVGEWVCVDAVTTVSDGGAGLATTRLSDRSGPVGVGAQSLLVAQRG
jgi:hypothetical protein